MATPLSESDLTEIEDLARSNTGEPVKGPLLALIAEVRRLRRLLLEGTHRGLGRAENHGREAT